MSQGRGQRVGAGLHERSVVVADCKGRDHHVEEGWGDERGSWISEVEAHGIGR